MGSGESSVPRAMELEEFKQEVKMELEHCRGDLQSVDVVPQGDLFQPANASGASSSSDYVGTPGTRPSTLELWLSAEQPAPKGAKDALPARAAEASTCMQRQADPLMPRFVDLSELSSST